MEKGYVALYQKMRPSRLSRAVVRDVAVVRVPVPRSKYNRVGEKKGGRAAASTAS
jgi:hypothetical protein